MPKKIIILISSILILLLVSLVGYYFIIQNGNVTGDNGIVSNFRSFLPFGGNEGSDENSTTTPEIVPEDSEPIQTSFTEKLRKISSEPVSGAGILDLKAGTVVRYIEKATGHIFETELFSPKHERISNTTIPLVYDAVWSDGAGSLVARYLSEDDISVETYALILKAGSGQATTTSTSTEETLSGISFPDGISDVSSFGTSVFYLIKTSGYSQGYVSSFDGTKRKLVWNSEIKELNSQFVNDRTIALNTKPYQGVNGYLYLVDTTTGQSRSILNATPGLSALVSPDASMIFYISQKQIVNAFVLDQSTKETKSVTPVAFPEKCIWSTSDKNILYCAITKEILTEDSMTRWYQGSITFSDDIWRYDIKNGTSDLLVNLSTDAGESIDVIKPIISDNGQYLVFINKIDNSLWSLDLTK